MSAINLPGSPFPFDSMMVFGWIAAFLLVGMVLRYYIPFFRRYLIPACILGGTLGLIVRSLGGFNLLGIGVSNELFQIIVFHLFNLTWVFLGLKLPNKNSQTGQNTKLVSYIFLTNLGAVALMSGVCMLAGFGLKIFDFAGPVTMGTITTTGFTGGPGQALTASGVWTQVSGIQGLNDFALASSSAGYAFAIIFGIPLMNIIARKKKLKALTDPNNTDQDGFYDDYDCAPSTCKDTTIATNIDTLAFHFCLGLFAYFLLIFILQLIVPLMPVAVLPLVWGVFFLFSYVAGFVVRKLLKAFKKDILCCNNVNNKISNSLVDLLVCGTFISVEVGAIGTYLVPFITYCVICLVVCAALCWFSFGKFKNEGPEYFAFTFGTWTGTISTGLILTRMVDPENKSSVAVNFGIANALLIPYVVFATFTMHMEVVYKYPPIYPLLINLSIGVVVLVLARFIKIDKTAKLWQSE